MLASDDALDGGLRYLNGYLCNELMLSFENKLILISEEKHFYVIASSKNILNNNFSANFVYRVHCINSI